MIIKLKKCLVFHQPLTPTEPEVCVCWVGRAEYKKMSTKQW